MAPTLIDHHRVGTTITTRAEPTRSPTRADLTIDGGILEAWSQGYNVGSLVILILIVFCNYRAGILLHKLILLELVLALWHGTFIFIKDPVYGWYLSSTAALLFISYQLHNVVSWLKIRPFLPPWVSRLFILSLLAVQPFWIAEAWSNFAYYNNLGSTVNARMRPFEALLRDPWWIFTTWKLVSAIKKTYGFSIWELTRINARFGVMLACMAISIVFLLTDVVINALHLTVSSGIDPYWRFALVFKCASDTIFLDDFKSVLDEIIARNLSAVGGGARHGGQHGRTRSHSASSALADVVLMDYAHDPESTAAQPVGSGIEKGPERPKRFNMVRANSRKPSAPTLPVQRDPMVASEMQRPDSDDWESVRGLLRTPETVVHGPSQQRCRHCSHDES